MTEREEQFFFCDEFEHTLDSQRRFAIPSEWRYQGADSRFVIIPARDSILQLYTYQGFKDIILSKLSHMSPANAKEAKELALLGSRTLQCACDKQGRIQLSQKLIDYAGLSDRVALNGSVLYAEILTPERWRARHHDDEEGREEFLDLLERLHESKT